MYKHVTAIEVFIWGHHVGTIAPLSGRHYRFEYDREFLNSGIELAPFELPLRSGEFSFPGRSPGAFYGMPAAFADSIPDSFGNAIIDEWMERQGVLPSSVSPLDRLAYVGSRAMGALEYQPERGPRREQKLAVRMKSIVEQAKMVISHKLEKVTGKVAFGCEASLGLVLSRWDFERRGAVAGVKYFRWRILGRKVA